MDKKQIEEILIEIIKEITSKDEVTPEMEFGTDIMLTSLMAMKLLQSLEQKLDVKDIPTEILFETETVSDLADVLSEYVSK